VRASEARPAHLLLPPAAYSSLPPSFRARLSTKDRQHASETTSRHPPAPPHLCTPSTHTAQTYQQRQRRSEDSRGGRRRGQRRACRFARGAAARERAGAARLASPNSVLRRSHCAWAAANWGTGAWRRRSKALSKAVSTAMPVASMSGHVQPAAHGQPARAHPVSARPGVPLRKRRRYRGQAEREEGAVRRAGGTGEDAKSRHLEMGEVGGKGRAQGGEARLQGLHMPRPPTAAPPRRVVPAARPAGHDERASNAGKANGRCSRRTGGEGQATPR